MTPTRDLRLLDVLAGFFMGIGFAIIVLRLAGYLAQDIVWIGPAAVVVGNLFALARILGKPPFNEG